MIPFVPSVLNTDPFEQQRNLEPGETRRRLARAKYEEDIPMYLHIHESAINAKNTRLLEEAMLAERIRIARGGQPGMLASVTTSIRRSIGTLLISMGERLQPVDINAGCTDCPDTVMQA